MLFRAVVLLCASVSLAAASDVTGSWHLTAKAPGGNDEIVVLSFHRTNGKLAGAMSQGSESAPLQNIRENGADLTFEVRGDGGKLYSVQLTLTGDTLSGSIDGSDGFSGACTAVRKPADPPLAPAAGFLARHSQPLDLANFDASLLDTEGKQIFFLGESHGIALNDDLDLALLRYLHKTAGVRVYLAEWGYAAGCLMNRYMETGDEHFLDFMMREGRGAVSWTKERRAFVVKLREWNLTLPGRDRIRVVGLDIEHQARIAVWYLHELTAQAQPAPASIRDAVAALNQLDAETASDSAIQKISGDLADGLRRRRQDYVGWLGERLLEFDVVAANLQNRYEAYADREKKLDIVREAAMYETFLKLQPMLAGVRCYGRWGAAHVAQRRYENRDPFAARLNRSDSPVAGKVLTIWPLHENCEALYWAGGDYRTRTFSDASAMMQPVEAAARSQLTLFKLPGPGSPFAKALYQFTAGDGGVTTDYAQYLLFIKDGKPTHLMEGSARMAGQRPFVVRTEPVAESRAVSPGVIEIKVTFSEEMNAGQFSYVTGMAGQAIKYVSDPVLQSDRRTYVIKAKVDPGKTYATWLNTERHSGFRSVAGEPAVPYLLTFKTSDR